MRRLVWIALVAACGEPSPAPADAGPDAPVTAMTILAPDGPFDQGSVELFEARHVPDGQIVTWSLSGDGALDATGRYTAPLHPGTAQIRATAGDATAMVAVTISAVEVQFTSATLALPFDATQELVLSVTGSVDKAYQLALVEQDGGSLAGNTYTAPGIAGTYHVTATAHADPTKVATLAIGVAHGPMYAAHYVVTGFDTGFAMQLDGIAGTNTIITGNSSGTFAMPVITGQAFTTNISAYAGGSACVAQDPAGIVPAGDITIAIDCAPVWIGSRGACTYPDQVGAIVARPDGKLVLTRNGQLQQLDAANAIDTSFGDQGVGAASSAQHLAIAGDGSILALTSDGSAVPSLARFTAGGAVDTTFGTDGAVAINWFGIGGITLLGQLVLADGGAYVAGSAYDGVATRAVVGRLTSGGAFDPAFGTGGKLQLAGTAVPVLVASAAGLYVVASSTDGATVARLTPTGAADPAFAPTALPMVHPSGAALVGGRLVVLGQHASDVDLDQLYGLTPAGGLDPSFATSPFALPHHHNSFVSPRPQIVALPGGGALIGGTTLPELGDNAGHFVSYTARLLADGTRDAAFGTRTTQLAVCSSSQFAGRDTRALLVRSGTPVQVLDLDGGALLLP